MLRWLKDGTLIETARSSARSGAGHDLWYSGKNQRHGDSIQVISDRAGFAVSQARVETVTPRHRLPLTHRPHHRRRALADHHGARRAVHPENVAWRLTMTVVGAKPEGREIPVTSWTLRIGQRKMVG